MDAFELAALDSAVRVLRSVFSGNLPDDTLPQEDVLGALLAVSIDSVGLPATTATLDALVAWAWTT